MIELKNFKLTSIKGVGPKKEQLLNKININNIYDLITYYPRSYEDMSNINNISDSLGEKGLFYVEVISTPNLRRVRGNMTLLTVNVTDGNTSAELVFFNQPYYQNYFKKGYKKYIYGEVKKHGFVFQISSPRLINKNELGKLEPIYNLTSGLTNNELKKIINLSIALYENQFIEFLPDEVLSKFSLVGLKSAIKSIHHPKDKEDLLNSRRRLAFNELYILQGVLEYSNYRDKEIPSPKILYDEYKDILYGYINSLEFKLTNAQLKVTNEIIEDLKSSSGMNRLLQGDVGSGKTIVASIAILLNILNSYQCAYMAPTEILAKQHYKSIKTLLEPQGFTISLLTGDLKQKEKEEVYKALKEGAIDVVVGTHALIQDSVKFKNLGLTVIDEQHRFGVDQRKALYNKGINPNNLSMTATPIPRTLALVIYGDMEVSIIDELPPGRQEIDTFVVDDSYINRLDSFIIEQIKNGRQVFVVCPLIEENEMPLKSLEKVYKHYSGAKFINQNIKTDFLHGKMKNDEKNFIMERFLKNESQILVSTTVIEVGINVPNANLMIIYNADRFGLSQLHQLRGRVGRGKYKSYCVLINNNQSEIAYRRMKVMKQSNDGFYIADKDLELRGQGELMGTKQHGIADLKITNLKTDIKLIELVKSNYKIIYDVIVKNKTLYNEYINNIQDKVKDLNSLEN